MITILFLLSGSSWGEEQTSNMIIAQIEKAQPIIDDTIYGNLVFGNISIKSPIYITNCTFTGVVDFRGARFEKPLILANNKFKGKLFANNSTQFNGDIIFDDSEFYDIINFRNTSFKNIQFKDAKFAGDVIFGNCRFIGKSDFSGAIFSGDADFEGCAFNKRAGFDRCKFKKGAHFQGIKSRGASRTTFSNSEFSGDADFSNAHLFNSSANDCTFKKSAIFSDVKFERVSYFRRTDFRGLADFERCDFLNDTRFVECVFNRSAFFNNVNFFNNADFSRSIFEENAEFLGAFFHGNSTFNETQFNGDLSFEGATFSGCLALSKTKFNKMYVRWNDIRDHLEYDDAAYMALQENFKKLGLIDDLDGCYYRYRSSHRQQNWKSTIQTGMLGSADEKFRKFIDFWLDILYKYGVDPLRPFIISLILILFCAFLWWIIGIGEIVDSSGKNIIKNGFWSEVTSLREPIIFSFLIFFSAAKFFIDIPVVKIPPPIERTYSWSKYIFFVERAFAGILLALLFIAISRTIIRNA